MLHISCTRALTWYGNEFDEKPFGSQCIIIIMMYGAVITTVVFFERTKFESSSSKRHKEEDRLLPVLQQLYRVSGCVEVYDALEL